MKYTGLFLATLGASLHLHAQEPGDALRTSFSPASGTARQQAIGGAMGSVGGDLGATFVNPAGLGFYRTGDLVLSPAFGFGKQRSTYFGQTGSDRQASPLVGTSGVVLGGGTRGQRSSAFSLAVSRTADFNRNLTYAGANNTSSVSQRFLEEIRNNGTRNANVVAEEFPFTSSLAFNTFLIDTVGGGTNGAFQFQSRAPIGNLLQEQVLEQSGGITEAALGLAVNLRDKVMVGGTIGLPFYQYRRTSTFLEADATENTANNFNYTEIKERLQTKGGGFNIKAGVIFKPTDRWRLGFAAHSPTIMSLTDTYSAEITTDTENYMGVQRQSSDFLAGAEGEYGYTLVTPYKLLGSVSFVLREIEDVTKQRGFITADLEYVNHASSAFMIDEEYTTLASDKEYFRNLNRVMNDVYKGAFNFRVGGELKFTTLMVRAGGAYYGNPYRMEGEKGSRIQLSGGLGYRARGRFIDLTYVHSRLRDTNLPYRLQYAASPAAQVRGNSGQVVLSVGWKI